MRFLILTLKIGSAYGTPFLGDTLFGQFCWAIRNRLGESRLKTLLDGYTQHNPFTIISDAFPNGYLPRPTLPGRFFDPIEHADRKKVKKRIWMPVQEVFRPVNEWLAVCKTSKQLLEDIPESSIPQSSCKKVENSFRISRSQPHNTINRNTGTTGEREFAPYTMAQDWYQSSIPLNVYALFDEDRISENELKTCMQDIGDFGFGRDASIGLGKFQLESAETVVFKTDSQANACLTIAPVVPQGTGLPANSGFYLPFTRFGRHGDQAVHLQGKPFKNPVLLARSGAIFMVEPPAAGFIGQGIGGAGQLSKTIPQTVHQGYSPVVPVKISKARGT